MREEFVLGLRKKDRERVGTRVRTIVMAKVTKKDDDERKDEGLETECS